MKELIELAGAISNQLVPIEYTPANGEEARYLIANTSKAEADLGFIASRRLEVELPALL